MTVNMRALMLTVGCLCFLSRPVHGAGKDLQVEYPPSTAANQLQIGVTYTMWVPDDVARFRCVIVHQHGAGRDAAAKGSTAAYDLTNRGTFIFWNKMYAARGGVTGKK